MSERHHQEQDEACGQPAKMLGIVLGLGFDSGMKSSWLSAGRSRMKCPPESADDDEQPGTGSHSEMLAWSGAELSNHWLQKTNDGGDGLMVEVMKTVLGMTQSGSDQSCSQQAGLRMGPIACPQQAARGESTTPLLSFPRYPRGRGPKIPPHD